ncbi:MAG: flagellar basal body rod protein FlgB [Methylocystis sp.]|nr:flagellar basal body rod protein FlgB [Methylocystis sp.]
MEPVYLFNLVDQQRSWLSARQALVAQNIANANTPAYRAVDVMPFAKVLDHSALQMASANPMHLQMSASDANPVSSKEKETWEVSYSGNSVSLEQEMMKSGDIRGAFSLDTSIMKAFHGMWLASVRG